MSQNLTIHTHTWSAVRIALIAGAIAGPLYVGVGTLEAVLRSGFDIRIHSLSLLANGRWGWMHSAMMVVSGLLTVIGALGVSRVQRQTGRRAYAMIIGLVIYGWASPQLVCCAPTLQRVSRLVHRLAHPLW
jgi:hypothetical protein